MCFVTPQPHPNLASLLISGSALVVSLLSYYFARKSWQETNRPIITARVTTNSGGNVATCLDIIVQNTGNRPAKNVKLKVIKKALESLLTVGEGDPSRTAIEKCFADTAIIPILENGRSVTNSFGCFSKEKSTWKPNNFLIISVYYENLEGKKFHHEIPLLIADDQGFAGSFWSESKANQK